MHESSPSLASQLGAITARLHAAPGPGYTGFRARLCRTGTSGRGATSRPRGSGPWTYRADIRQTSVGLPRARPHRRVAQREQFLAAPRDAHNACSRIRRCRRVTRTYYGASGGPVPEPPPGPGGYVGRPCLGNKGEGRSTRMHSQHFWCLIRSTTLSRTDGSTTTSSGFGFRGGFALASRPPRHLPEWGSRSIGARRPSRALRRRASFSTSDSRLPRTRGSATRHGGTEPRLYSSPGAAQLCRSSLAHPTAPRR